MLIIIVTLGGNFLKICNYVIDDRLLGYINSLSTKPFLKEFVSHLAKVAFLH